VLHEANLTKYNLLLILLVVSILSHFTAIPSITAFEKGGLKVTFNFEKDSSYANTVRITLTAVNSASQPMNEFLFQAAVPKVCTRVLFTIIGWEKVVHLSTLT